MAERWHRGRNCACHRSRDRSRKLGTTELTVVGARLLFVADDGSLGRELWKTDGTAAGTTLVKDIAPGPSRSDSHDLVASGATVYFSATDGTLGSELWKSDGTEAGTLLVHDIDPGAAGSNLWGLAAGGASLVFTATDGSSGYEPWWSDGTEAGTVLMRRAHFQGYKRLEPADFQFFFDLYLKADCGDHVFSFRFTGRVWSGGRPSNGLDFYIVGAEPICLSRDGSPGSARRLS